MPDCSDVRARMRAIASERRRFGYRRIGLVLEREDFVMNSKKPRRLDKEESLAVRRRRRDHNDVQPHSAPGGLNPAQARRASEVPEGWATDAALAPAPVISHQAPGPPSGLRASGGAGQPRTSRGRSSLRRLSNDAAHRRNLVGSAHGLDNSSSLRVETPAITPLGAGLVRHRSEGDGERHQRLLDRLARLQEAREAGPGPQLGDPEVQRPQAGFERPVTVAVAARVPRSAERSWRPAPIRPSTSASMMMRSTLSARLRRKTSSPMYRLWIVGHRIVSMRPAGRGPSGRVGTGRASGGCAARSASARCRSVGTRGGRGGAPRRWRRSGPRGGSP